MLNGVALGSILALVALGLTIVFGLLGFVNFAHGALFTVGAYAGWQAYTRTGSFALGMLAAMVVTFVLGTVLERVLIRFYYDRPTEDQILVTFGLGIVLVETVRAIFSGQTQLVPTPPAAHGGVGTSCVCPEKIARTVSTRTIPRPNVTRIWSSGGRS